MIHKTGMGIDAYLRNAGIKPADMAPGKHLISLESQPGQVFAADLASAMSSLPLGAAATESGLTISDYRSQATSGASRGFFRNSTLRGGSPGRVLPDRFGNGLVPLKKDRIAAAPAAMGATTGAEAAQSSPSDSGALIAESIRSAARKHNLSEKLIASVIRAESNFQVDAVSPAGARGLMQLMPATARELGVDDPFDIRQNIDGGAAYLRRMLDRFNGDLRLALSAYNAGPGTVEKYKGNVPYRETQNYVERVLKGVAA